MIRYFLQLNFAMFVNGHFLQVSSLVTWFSRIITTIKLSVLAQIINKVHALKVLVDKDGIFPSPGSIFRPRMRQRAQGPGPDIEVGSGCVCD